MNYRLIPSRKFRTIVHTKRQRKNEKSMPKVINLRTKDCPKNAKIVDRSTPYGNPFIMHSDGDRDEVCDKFRIWISRPEQKHLRDKAKAELKGHDLACWCAPKRCHADTWLAIANEE